MKKLLFLFVAGLIGSTTLAQDLPQPSPFSKVEQKVGLTDITIEYSRPGVKGRTIFGDLVPYDKVWRLGANACTKFTTSTEMSIQGEKLDAGTYAVFAIPSATGAWQVVFNTDTEQWGAGNYDESKNVLSVVVKAVEHAFTETFTISVNNITNNSAVVDMAWENVHFELALDLATEKIAEKNIQEAIKKGEELDKVYYRAASYYHKSLGDDKKALSYITKGLNVKQGHALQFLRAQILYKQGHKKEAIEYGEKAYELAMEAESKGWADYIKENVDSWKAEK